MQEILQQLGAMFIGAIPTALLFIVLVIAYQFLIQGPLTAVLAKRRALTEGAMEDARKAIAEAEAKTAEYAERLRQARAEAYKVREQRVKQWNAERDAALDAARKAAGEKVRQAKAELDAEAASARADDSSLRRRSGRPGCPRRPARRRRGFPLRKSFLQMRFMSILLLCVPGPVAAFAAVRWPFAPCRAAAQQPQLRRQHHTARKRPPSRLRRRLRHSQGEEEQEQAFCMRPSCNRWRACCISISKPPSTFFSALTSPSSSSPSCIPLGRIMPKIFRKRSADAEPGS